MGGLCGNTSTVMPKNSSTIPRPAGKGTSSNIDNMDRVNTPVKRRRSLNKVEANLKMDAMSRADLSNLKSTDVE